jgi:hypothetical protein
MFKKVTISGHQKVVRRIFIHIHPNIEEVEDRSPQESSYRINRVLESQYRERQWRYLVEIEGLLTPIWLRPEFVPNIMLQEFEVRCIREVSRAMVRINVDDNDPEPDAYDPETPR